MGADLLPRDCAGLLHLLGVLHPELLRGFQGTLLALGFGELTSREVFEQLRDGGAALLSEDSYTKEWKVLGIINSLPLG
ncbi:hypothetical protein OG607_00740 [Streptomyces sp. NBC_01537]|uniref:hypothetical protein n=1 Tax=Streptomyces sp. NBC_01537 TaxID=2903896 RepID=UPI00386688D2